MSRPQLRLRVAMSLACALSAVALVVMALKAPILTAVCLAQAGLLGFAAMRLRPGRPSALYGAFAVLACYVVWRITLGVQAGDTLVLVPSMLLAVGAFWVLQEPAWTASAFLVFAAMTALGLSVQRLVGSYDLDLVDPVSARHIALASTIVVLAEVLFLAVGLTQTLQRRLHQARRRLEPQVQPVVSLQGQGAAQT
jgi:hypothetical protein